jgi:hypothetical protein
MRNRYQKRCSSYSLRGFAFLDLKGLDASVRLSTMKSALRLILGVSLLASVVGCDGGGDEDGPKAVAGSGGGVIPNGGTTGGGGAGTTGGTGTGGDLPAGVPLTILDGWVAVDQNSLGVQGAVFSYADPTSAMSLMEVKTGASYCISGTAAKVDKASTACTTMMFTAPATDCYGEYWGAAIGMNLNQPIDPATMEGVMTPLPFDASSVKGFAFNIDGPTLPTTLRFKVEGTSGEFCTPPAKPLLKGNNTFMLTDLVAECWETGAATMNPNAETIKSGIVKIAWQVTTKDTMAIPYDYCVTDVRALQ